MILILIIAFIAIFALGLIGAFARAIIEGIFEGIAGLAMWFWPIFKEMRLWLKIVSIIAIPSVPTGLVSLITWFVTNDVESVKSAAKITLCIIGVIAWIAAMSGLFIAFLYGIEKLGELFCWIWNKICVFFRRKRDLFFKKKSL